SLLLSFLSPRINEIHRRLRAESRCRCLDGCSLGAETRARALLSSSLLLACLILSRTNSGNIALRVRFKRYFVRTLERRQRAPRFATRQYIGPTRGENLFPRITASSSSMSPLTNE